MPASKGQGGRAQVPPATPTKTGGGGDGDDHTTVVVPGAVSDHPTSATRKAFVTDPGFEFDPASLVGSWFHRLENDTMVWQGVVVAEPQPGVYLLQIDKLDEGAENVQRLVPMQRLTTDDEGYDYRWYDTENEARSAYARWVATEHTR